MNDSSIHGVANSCRKAIHFVAVDAHIDRRKSFLSEEGGTDEIRDGWSYNSVADP